MNLLAEAVSELRPTAEFLISNGQLVWLDDLALKPSDTEITVKINEIRLREAKTAKIRELKNAFDTEFKNITSDVLFHEMVSWETQEKEALAYLADPTNAVTPFLDGLYTARNPLKPDLDADKTDLANKIISHGNAYKQFYSSLLGKYQKLVKAVQQAQTLLDLETISW